jgi:hypothetical protein
MREETINIYGIKELSEEARNRAFHNFYSAEVYPYEDKNEEVLNKFENIFPIEVNNWSYGGYSNYIRFNMTCDDGISELKEIRLLKYIWNNYKDNIFKGKYYSTNGYYDKNNKYHYKYRHSKIILNTDCVLTGYYLDMDILQSIYDFLNKPSDISFKELMEKCLNSWINTCNKDYENYFSMENFIEMSENNNWEYTKEGDLYIAARIA